MKSFKEFFQQQDNMIEEKGDIKKTLSKIPASHAALVKGFKWKFHGGNTLNGDNQHVGYMDNHSKEIAVAAPWNYSREFAVLHEIAHVVYERMPNQLKHQWSELIHKTLHKQAEENPKVKSSLKQSPEEIFCHSYANFYSKHKVETYNNPEWMAFIKNLA
jgi:hypothetical protein